MNGSSERVYCNGQASRRKRSLMPLAAFAMQEKLPVHELGSAFPVDTTSADFYS